MSQSAIARLSARAMAHVAAMPVLSPAVAANRLYGFHRQPLTAGWQRALPGGAEAVRFLFGAMQPVGYAMGADSHWLHFRAAEAVGPLVHKLYLSTQIAALPRLVQTVAPLFAELAVPAFKLGGAAADLLRADHMVAYFASPAHRDHAAAALAAALVPPGGPLVPPRGVPFTIPLAADPGGLLSWGTDPVDGRSFRIALIEAMAAALDAAAPEPGARLEAMRAGLAAAGICPDSFTPRDAE